MTFVDMSLPAWYLIVMLGRIHIRHRKPEEPPREEGGDEPRQAEPDDDFGVGDELTDTLFFARLRESVVVDEFTDVWSVWLAPELANFNDELDCALRHFDVAFYQEIGEGWAATVRAYELEKTQWLHRIDAVLEDTTEHPMLDLIGAR